MIYGRALCLSVASLPRVYRSWNVASGQGISSASWRAGFRRRLYFGLDADPHALYEERQKSPQKLLIAASAETLPFPEKRFDFVISLHMVEHLHRPEQFIRETARVLCPDGLLVLATPQPPWPRG
jgi:ubiquinone/menaquinone biosynthesis C-methylase UbiE